MAPNDPRRPGAPSGLSAILEREFGVPAQPTIGRRDVLDRVEEALAQPEFDGHRDRVAITVSDAPVARNALSDAAGGRVAFPEDTVYDRCFVALVDPDPMALWAHPAWWAFVPADGMGPVALRKTRLPEHPRGGVRLYPVR